MDTIQELKLYIQRIVGFYKFSTVANVVPDDPDDVVIITGYGGSSVSPFAGASYKYYQIQIRAKTHGKCQEIGRAVISKITSKPFITLAGNDCLYEVKGYPQLLMSDKKNRQYYTFNISVCSQN